MSFRILFDKVPEDSEFISGTTVIGQPRYSPVSEDRPAQPETAYQASKLYGEHIVRVAEPS